MRQLHSRYKIQVTKQSQQLSVDVWVAPVIQIVSPYINDQIEAGKTYEYDIKLKNTGDDPVEINPEMDSSNRYEYGPYGMIEPPISDEDISITSHTTTCWEIFIYVEIPEVDVYIFKGGEEKDENIYQSNHWYCGNSRCDISCDALYANGCAFASLFHY
ncbi:MAG TPA: hypothetical protein VMW53_04880 [archaeon]|nr:hypothetical protein [archaeon]